MLRRLFGTPGLVLTMVVDPTAILNGLSRALLLFLIASGLSLIFGLMGVVNFAHGAFYALGGYLAVFAFGFSESFLVALFVAPFLVALVGILTEMTTIRPLYERDPIYQVLLTFGVSIILDELIKLVWGSSPLRIGTPGAISGITDFGFISYPTYRVFIIGFGLLVALGLWLFIQRTRVGIIVRAGTLDSEMVEAMGIKVQRVFTAMFGLGVGLAAVGGVVASPLLGVYPTMGTEILIQAFLVVVLGGLGSVRGALLGALIIGMAQGIGAYYISTFVGLILFVIMISVLLVRPYGLLGQPGIAEH